MSIVVEKIDFSEKNTTKLFVDDDTPKGGEYKGREETWTLWLWFKLQFEQTIKIQSKIQTLFFDFDFCLKFHKTLY